MAIGIPRYAGQTYNGRGVRYRPSAETTAYRNLNQQILREKFTPPKNSAEAFGQLIEERLRQSPPINDPNFQVQGTLKSSDLPLLANASVPDNIVFDFVGEEMPLPTGSFKDYEQLKKRAWQGGLGKVETNNPKAQVMSGINIQDDPELVWDGTYGSFGYRNLGRDPESHTGYFEPSISMHPQLGGLEKTKALSHELGHYLMGHGKVGYRNLADEPLLYGQKETEAEAVAYGVMKRLYPYKQPALENNMGQYVVGAQMYENQSVDPIEVLSNNADLINSAVARIVPTPRQPFRTITPGVYGMNTSPTRNLNPAIAQAQEQYQTAETQYAGVLQDMIGRYGY